MNDADDNPSPEHKTPTPLDLMRIRKPLTRPAAVLETYMLIERNSDSSRWVWLNVSAPVGNLEDISVTHGQTSHLADAVIEAADAASLAGGEGLVNIYSRDLGVLTSIDRESRWGNLLTQNVQVSREHPFHAYALNLQTEPEVIVEPLPPLTVAVDGSHNRESGGWAFIAENGEWRQAAGYAYDATSTELNAIKYAMNTLGRNRRLHILCDSKPAIHLLRNGHTATTAPAVKKIVLEITTSKRFANLTFEWVPGHSGNPLNEAANRLAIAGRRNLECGTSDDVAHKQAVAIVNEHMDAYRNNTQVEASTRPHKAA